MMFSEDVLKKIFEKSFNDKVEKITVSNLLYALVVKNVP